MKIIKVIECYSSGLKKDFNSVTSIEVADKPSFSGGFGDVYKCLKIDGVPISPKQVIKIFREKYPGSLSHNINTVRKLQVKIKNINSKLKATQNKGIIEVLPSLIAAPQFSFKGELEGNLITGFASNDLFELGFLEFEDVINQSNPAFNEYCRIPIQKKFLLAHQLVSSFCALEEFGFIHADMKPAALFINLESISCAIIDFDSGAIIESINDEPSTWGTKGDWIAPEIFDQLDVAKSADKINVDLFTDRWSVMIGIHYLLTTHHPLFFLNELSPNCTNSYLTNCKWPYADTNNAAYFDKSFEAKFLDYTFFVNKVLPPQISEKFACTINHGYRTPPARISYSDWKKAIESTFSLPKIIYFKSDIKSTVESLPVTLSWETTDAISISINNGVGNVPARGQVVVKPEQNKVYTLKAVGYFGEITCELLIDVHPLPAFEILKIPVPDFKSTLEVSFSGLDTGKMCAFGTLISNLPAYGNYGFFFSCDREETACNMDDKKINIPSISKVFEIIKSKIDVSINMI